MFQVWFQNKRSKERRMKQMTNGMVGGRGFFPGKGGRRGFPMIGDEFGYFPHDKPFHDFGYPNFPPPPDGFFPPGPMGFPMGGGGGPPPPPGGPNAPNMDQPLPMHGPPMNGPGMGSMPPGPGSLPGDFPPGQNPPGSSGSANGNSNGDSNSSSTANTNANNSSSSGPSANGGNSGGSEGTSGPGSGDFTITDLPPSRPSPDFQSNSGKCHYS